MENKTTKGFTLHSEDTAPEAAKAILADARAAFGGIPSLYAVMAESPAALSAYDAIWANSENSSLTAAERHTVYLTAAYENECRYCIAAHTVMSGGTALTDDQVEALRTGGPLDDPHLESLRRFASKVANGRGWVHEDETAKFLAAGFTRAQVLEVVVGVVTKALSNYVNHLVDTPLDPFMRGVEWAPRPAELA